MKVNQVCVKLEIGTTPKPYSTIKSGIELTATISENENYHDAYNELYQIAQEKVLNSLSASVNEFLKTFQDK